jgi:hypothetical protein
MSDNSRIPSLGQPPPDSVPVSINMAVDGTHIVVTFEPAATLMRFTPHTARHLAISLLMRAQMIDNRPIQLDP